MAVKKKILFYTRPCYVDAALEHIKLAKIDFDFHVVIQMSPTETTSNIFDFSTNLSNYKELSTFSEVAKDWHIEFFNTYLEGCASVHFLIYPNDGVKALIKSSKTFIRFARALRPDYIHFDDLTGKQFTLIPFLLSVNRKVILNVHDPKPHLGEKTLRSYLQTFLYRIPKSLVVFSEYSKKLLSSRLSTNQNITVLKLLPYTVFKQFDNRLGSTEGRTAISFVGRLSPYKGVELFIDAIIQVVKDYPNQKFIIAGNTLFGYQLDDTKINFLRNNLAVVQKHLSNSEMVEVIKKSQLVVCPYLDATQSGVILTAFALDTPVLVTNVGGLAEYISDANSGIICNNVDSGALATKIKEFLTMKLIGEKDFVQLIKDVTAVDIESNLKALKYIYA